MRFGDVRDLRIAGRSEFKVGARHDFILKIRDLRIAGRSEFKVGARHDFILKIRDLRIAGRFEFKVGARHDFILKVLLKSNSLIELVWWLLSHHDIKAAKARSSRAGRDLASPNAPSRLIMMTADAARSLPNPRL